MRVIIIEDEQLIAKNLEQIIAKCRPAYTVVKFIQSVDEAIRYFQFTKEQFDLIFCDISLGDGLCFEIFEKIEIKVPIIFCTAFDNYAIEAFNTNGIDYVLKPLNQDRLNKAILKFENLAFNNLIQQKNIQQVITQLKPKPIFLVNFREKVIPFESTAIAAFFIQDGIVYLLDFNGKRYSILKSLEEIEVDLDDVFYRANRQMIISKNAIKEFERTESRKLIVHLSVPFADKITISKEKISSFQNWLKGN